MAVILGQNKIGFWARENGISEREIVFFCENIRVEPILCVKIWDLWTFETFCGRDKTSSKNMIANDVRCASASFSYQNQFFLLCFVASTEQIEITMIRKCIAVMLMNLIHSKTKQNKSHLKKKKCLSFAARTVKRRVIRRFSCNIRSVLPSSQLSMGGHFPQI